MNTKVLTTERFARLILSRVNVVHSFIKDNEWYDIVCAKVLEPQSVFISRSVPSSEKPVMFNLLDYFYLEPYQCLDEMIIGLREFNSQDTWTVKQTDLARLNIQYKQIN